MCAEVHTIYGKNMSSITETTETASVPQSVKTSSARFTSELRIDAPHFVGVAPEFVSGPTMPLTPQSVPTPELSKVTPPAIPLGDTHERIERQASELGNRLENRCRNLDQRESHLNSRSAEFDRELRSARLWITEKQEELHKQETQLDAEARALGEVAKRQAECEVVEQTEQEDELQQRCEELKKVERHLREAKIQLELCRRQLVEKRTEFDHYMADQRKILAHYQAQVEADLFEKRAKLDRQSKTNEQIRVVLGQCRREIERKHRESLQLRLATEELWVRMSDGASTAVMLQSLSKIRSRIADEYRQAEARLVKKAS